MIMIVKCLKVSEAWTPSTYKGISRDITKAGQLETNEASARGGGRTEDEIPWLLSLSTVYESLLLRRSSLGQNAHPIQLHHFFCIILDICIAHIITFF